MTNPSLPTDSAADSAAGAARPAIAILWPAFLAACALELIVFASFDPADFHGFGQRTMSDIGVLSIAFFAFWAITAVAGYVTVRLATGNR